MQPHPRFLLQGAHDAEEILGARVAVRGEHSVQAFAGLLDLRGQLLEADRGVDQIAQNGLARDRVTPEIRIDRLRKERLAKTRVTLRARRDRGLEIPCESHTSSPLALTRPSRHPSRSNGCLRPIGTAPPRPSPPLAR